MLLLHDGKPPTPGQVEKERKKIVEHKLKFLGGGNPADAEIAEQALHREPCERLIID